MEETQKPFACSVSECGMSFTNEDHLNVHTKKHDMVLQLGIEQKNVFVADQTPTPTRFIRNCEEVGLFQDLQNVTVNPFDEGFKRAIESKHHLLSLDAQLGSTDELHTPQVFPLIDADTTLYSTSDGHITISRSSSEEGKHSEATLTKSNHVTINRVANIEKINDVTIVKNTELHTDTISYKNTVTIYNKEEFKNGTQTDNEKDFIKDKPPIMSQQSIDYIVDSYINDERNKLKEGNVQKKGKTVNKRKLTDDFLDDYEVIIKLPCGKQMVMKAVDNVNVKDVLKKNLTKKIQNDTQTIVNTAQKPIAPIQLPSGTLIPVTLVTQDGKPIPNIPVLSNNLKLPINNFVSSNIQKLPLPNFKTNNNNEPVIIRRISRKSNLNKSNQNVIKEVGKRDNLNGKSTEPVISDSIKTEDDIHDLTNDDETQEDTAKNIEKRSRFELESRNAASKRYRVKVRETLKQQSQEIQQLKLANEKLMSEKAVLKLLVTEHLKKCPIAEDLRATQEKIQLGCGIKF